VGAFLGAIGIEEFQVGFGIILLIRKFDKDK